VLSPFYRVSDGVRHWLRSRAWPQYRAAGRRGEDLAHRYLRRQRMTVVARNYHARSGVAELDLIARDGDGLVFVEVKTRTNGEFGPPERAIDEVKREHLFRAALEYARRSGVPWNNVRFDIVGVLLTDPPRIEHFRDVFPLERDPFVLP